MQPETIDLKPTGYLNPARRPIAQTGQHGLSLITKMQFVAAGPIWSQVSTYETDETKREKAYTPTKEPRDIRVAPNVLWDSNRVLVIQRACQREAGIHNGPGTFLRLPRTVHFLFYGKNTDRDPE